MSPQHTDYYALLGIGRGASAADVDRAYRRAARASHLAVAITNSGRRRDEELTVKRQRQTGKGR